MVSRCTRLAIGSLALCVASSAGAQETLERGKTLYASYCVTCHESPQRVTTSPGGVDLEKFLLEHYPATPEISCRHRLLPERTGTAPDPSPETQAQGRREPLSAKRRRTRPSERRIQGG